jgi:hypothetical protein
LAQYRRVILRELRARRVDRQRPRNEILGKLKVAVTRLEKTQKVKRVKIVRISIDQSPIEGGSFSKPAGSM